MLVIINPYTFFCFIVKKKQDLSQSKSCFDHTEPRYAEIVAEHYLPASSLNFTNHNINFNHINT
jgi:hypothetical protein